MFSILVQSPFCFRIASRDRVGREVSSEEGGEGQGRASGAAGSVKEQSG